MPQVEQDMLTLPEHLISPLVFGGVRVTQTLVLFVLSCVYAIICLFVFVLFFIQGVVRLFSIYAFACPPGIFRPLLK